MALASSESDAVPADLDSASAAAPSKRKRMRALPAEPSDVLTARADAGGSSGVSRSGLRQGPLATAADYAAVDLAAVRAWASKLAQLARSPTKLSSQACRDIVVEAVPSAPLNALAEDDGRARDVRGSDAEDGTSNRVGAPPVGATLSAAIGQPSPAGDARAASVPLRAASSPSRAGDKRYRTGGRVSELRDPRSDMACAPVDAMPYTVAFAEVFACSTGASARLTLLNILYLLVTASRAAVVAGGRRAMCGRGLVAGHGWW